MTTGYQIKNQEALYILTFQVVDWIDIFTRKIYKDILIDSFKYSMKNKGFHLYAYVIMSNHVHLIANSPDGKLSDTIRDLKKYTSRTIVQAVKDLDESRKHWMLDRFKFNASQRTTVSNYQLWTHENHSIQIDSDKFITERVDYIHNNPVRAGIVEKPEYYLYSSARNYAGLDAPIEIPLMMLKWRTYR